MNTGLLTPSASQRGTVQTCSSATAPLATCPAPVRRAVLGRAQQLAARGPPTCGVRLWYEMIRGHRIGFLHEPDNIVVIASVDAVR